MIRHPAAGLSRADTVVPIELPRLINKCREILRQTDHPQHTLLVNLIETALALDAPDDADWCPPFGMPRPS